MRETATSTRVLRLRLLGSLRYFAAHRMQLALALLGVTIGVAAVVAVDLARRSVHQAFESSVRATTGAATHRIVGADGISNDAYVALRRGHGGVAMAPVVSASITVAGQPWTLLGVDPVREAGFGRGAAGWDAGAEFPVARWFGGEPLVLLPAGTGVAGDQFRFELDGASLTAGVAGHLPGRARVAIADIGVVQRWLETDRIDRIDLRLQGPLSPSLRRDAGPDLHIEAVPDSTAGLSAAFELNLVALSLLTALVGAFIVFNTFHFLVLQRSELFALERQLGVLRRQQRRQVLLEAVLVGAVGCVLGGFAGIGLGQLTLTLMRETVSNLYYDVAGADLLLDPVVALKGLAAGLLGCLAAALAPARTAGAGGRDTSTRRWFGLAAAMAVTGLVLLLAPGNLLMALAGVFLLALGYALLVAPVGLALLRPVVDRLPLRHPLAGLGLRRLRGSLPRMLPSTAALVLAVSTVVGIGTMIDSFRSSVARWLDQSLSADYYLGALGAGRVPAAVERELRTAPEVAAITRFLTLDARLGDADVELSIQDLNERAQASYPLLAGDEETIWAEFPAGRTLITENLARRHGLGIGDPVVLEVAGDTVTLTVGAVVVDYRTGPGRVLVSWDWWRQREAGLAPGSLGLYLESDGGPSLERRVQALLERHGGLRFAATGEIRRQSLEIFDQTFELTRALQWLAAIVALIGLTGSLAALQLERRQELALLAALGMTSLERRRALRLEALVIGTLVGLLALPLGGLLAWALTAVINPRAFGWYLQARWVPEALLGALAIALVGSWLAGLLAARRSVPAS